MPVTMYVHVYRNREDDDRLAADLYFCSACGGWYGVPHNDQHCQKAATAAGIGVRESCACRFCREATGQPIEGSFGFFTRSKRWQP